VGLRSLACWDHGFESYRGHGCLSVVIVVFCQGEFSASVWSIVQRSLTDCGASLCDVETCTAINGKRFEHFSSQEQVRRRRK